MKIRLQVETSNNAAFIAEHTGPRICVGREEGCELVLQGPGCDTVSRQHISIEQTDLGILVTDLGSANGTLLNDNPLENPEPLVVGDRIQLGHTGPVLQVLDLDATVGDDAEPEPREPGQVAATSDPGVAALRAAVARPAAVATPTATRPKRFPVVAVGLGVGVGVCALVTLAILAMWKLFGVHPQQTSTAIASHTGSVTHTTQTTLTTSQSTEKSTNITAATTKTIPATTKTTAATQKENNPKKNYIVPDEPNFERREIGRYMPNEKTPSVLLARQGDAERWGRLRGDSKVFTGYQLLALPGYRTPLMLDSGAKLMLWGNLPQFSSFPPVLESSVILFVPPKDFDLDFSLERGRVLLGNGKKSGECRIRLRFLREIWDITLPDEKSEVAVELWSVFPPDAPATADPSSIKPVVCVGLFANGSANVRAGAQNFNISKNEMLTWTSAERRVSGPETLKALPDWWTKTPDQKIPEIADAQLALGDYHVALGKSNNTLIDDIVTRVREKRDDPGLEATGILFLGAMDSLPLVIDGLERSDTVIRGAAVTALRQWITRGPDYRQELIHALTDARSGYSPEKAQLILWLLQGVNEADAGRSETFQKLIGCLNHENLPIRDLAFRELKRLVPELTASIEYDPAAPEKQRQQAAEEWKKKLPPGKVPARPASPGVK
jgi:pSer/pThr/pTyr-binding forkhead associated (FHA) protein